MNRRYELGIVAALSVLAAIRVFVFAAAFPVFSQVDEDLHFDLVLRYARGQIPRTFDLIAPETLKWVVPYASPEFLQDPQQWPEHVFPPPLWKQSGPEADAIAAETRAEWSKEINLECSQPPLYYSVAALWWKVGQMVGITGISAVYWLRFLNTAFVAILVWLGYATASSMGISNVIFRIGVPFVVAFFPQDILYVINNDALSSVCGALVFLCAMRVLTANSISLSLAAITGLAIAASYLTKVSNTPLAGLALVVVVAKIIWQHRSQSRHAAAAICTLCLTAFLPIALWITWVRTNFGDFTGDGGKAAVIGWTAKPFSLWWDHPIFSPHGFWTFWSDLALRFWKGEFMWHGAQIAWPLGNIYYPILTLIILGLAAIRLFRKNGAERAALGLALVSFLASVGFLMLISIKFDFGHCVYPSRAFPYLTAGRLIIGELVPFAVLFVYGIVGLLEPLGRKLTVAVLILLMSLPAVSQVVLYRPVFASEHNWFHR